MAIHRPRKRFAQHFLRDPNVLAQMLRTIHPQRTQRLLEIGPGDGALTCPLLKLHGELTAIELDRDLTSMLDKKCRPLGRLKLIQGDAMQFDYATLASPDDKIRIVGNLPYNIATPILFHLADYAAVISDIHVLLQKEVADRIAAPPGNKIYGRLSIMMQITFAIECLFEVAPTAFYPPPKVRSAFIRLTPHARPLAPPSKQKKIAQVISKAFSQRRKTLGNSLRPLFDGEQIMQAGIDPSRRAETLTVEEFLALADVLPADSGSD